MQAFQLCVVFTLNFCNGSCQRNGIFAFLLIRKQDAERRCKKRARDNDDGKYDKKRRAAAQTQAAVSRAQEAADAALPTAAQMVQRVDKAARRRELLAQLAELEEPDRG